LNIVVTTLALTGWTKVLGFNPKRIAVILSPVGAAAITYTFSGNTPIAVPSTPPGITVLQSNIILLADQLGNCIQQDLYASDGGNGSIVSVTEIIDPEWRGN
jgi:hypothetical protein